LQNNDKIIISDAINVTFVGTSTYYVIIFMFIKESGKFRISITALSRKIHPVYVRTNAEDGGLRLIIK